MTLGTMQSYAPSGGDKSVHNYYMYYKDIQSNDTFATTLTKPCFRTTIAIDPNYGRACIIITGALVDSGASAYFINRKAIDKLGSKTWFTAPQSFEAANGNVVTYNEWVWICLWIGGVQQFVRAFVDDSDSNISFIIGIGAQDDFLLRMGPVGVGKKRKIQVTVAEDVTGRRRTRYVVPQDPANRPAEVSVVTNEHALARCAMSGFTVADLASEEELEAYIDRMISL